MAGYSLFEKVIDAAAEAATSSPTMRRFPLKLVIAIPFGAVFGLYWAVKLGAYDDPRVGIPVGIGAMLSVWAIGGAVTLLDHFETKKRRANKKPPVDFE